MSNKYFFAVFILAVLIAIGTVFYFFVMKDRVVFFSPKTNNSVGESIENDKNLSSDHYQSFFISGWLPYWQKEKGTVSVENNFSAFSEINPFALAVNPDGSLNGDSLKLETDPWPNFFQLAKEKNVAIAPTILWADAEAMHNIFSDSDLVNSHINSIADYLDKNNFGGVDIDYEGKDISDRDNFSNFLNMLHQKLSSSEKKMSCTVEARTDDSPPEDLTGTRAMSWANDFSALNNYCDSVRIMAYDQVFQIHRANVFDDPSDVPNAPNAGSKWVEEIINYSLRYIAPEKLVLGVPTYGWEFKIDKISPGYHYSRVGSINYPFAVEKARNAGVTPIRTNGGELSFVYQASDGEHLVTFSDAQSIQEKISLAKKYHLGGISIFKLDGSTDPELFEMLRKEK